MSKWPAIPTIVNDVASRKTSALEMVKKSLERIDEHKSYKAIIATVDKRAQERAEQIDKDIADGKEVGRLAGVPFIAKDNFLAFGADTTAASNILKGFDAPYQATAIEKLEAEGAICVAKANLDAFAHGSSTENSDFFVTHNPVDKKLVPGGSSGGSAAAVVLGLAPFALGTDTGGSIRLPASFCGCVGYKPTYGLVSRHGVVAMASSTDVIGPLTSTVEDAAVVLDVISGQDMRDSTMIERNHTSYENIQKSNAKKVGVIKEYLADDVDAKVKNSIKKVTDTLLKKGYEVSEVSIPSSGLALSCYYILCPAEIASNLARYDGQRYGYSDMQAKSLTESYEKSRSTGFGAEAKRRIMIGTYVLSSGYYDAYYKQAQLVRTKLINEFEKAFEKFDILLGPTAPTTAFPIGQKDRHDPMSMYLMDVMTVAANLVGVPAVSIPAPTSNHLPIGLQLIAAQREDRELLAFAKQVEELIG